MDSLMNRRFESQTLYHFVPHFDTRQRVRESWHYIYHFNPFRAMQCFCWQHFDLFSELSTSASLSALFPIHSHIDTTVLRLLPPAHKHPSLSFHLASLVIIATLERRGGVISTWTFKLRLSVDIALKFSDHRLWKYRCMKSILLCTDKHGRLSGAVWSDCQSEGRWFHLWLFQSTF